MVNKMDYSVNKKELYNSIRAIVKSCDDRLIEADLNSTPLIGLLKILVLKQNNLIKLLTKKQRSKTKWHI